jgi:arylsulfatase A-like enzyme
MTQSPPALTRLLPALALLLLISCTPEPPPALQLKDGPVAAGDPVAALIGDGRPAIKVRLLGVTRNAVELRRDRPARLRLSGRVQAALGVAPGTAARVTFTIAGGGKSEKLSVAPGSGWVEIDLTFPPGIEEIAVSCDAPGAGAFLAGPRAIGAGPPRLAGLIVIDALRADALGVYGAPGNPSPNLDRFAQQSAVFSRAHTVAPFTLTSMSSIFTGLWPWQHRVIFSGEGGLSLSADIPSLVEKFRAAGYYTAAFSGAYFSFADNGFARGFELMDERCANSFFYESADCLARRVESFVAAHPDEPLFLYVHFVDPHAPYWPPEPFRSRFTRGLKKPRHEDTARGLIEQFEDNRKWWQFLRRPSATDLAWLRGLYQGELAYVDDRMGPLLETIRQRCEQPAGSRNCALAITADHGEAFFEHGQMDHVADLHEPVMRVPLIVYGRVRPSPLDDPIGVLINQPYNLPFAPIGRFHDQARSLDIMPTLLELSGIEPPANIPGRSLSPALRLGRITPRPAVALHFVKGRKEYAVVLWPWKLFYRPDGDWTRLFNLDADPAETADLSQRHPEKVEELRKELEMLLALPPPNGAQPRPSAPETIKRLKDLGYIQK